MTNYDVIKKLIGPIGPVGETDTDNRNFENLKAMTDLVDDLINNINWVAANKKRQEFSMKRSGGYASEFLNDVKTAEYN